MIRYGDILIIELKPFVFYSDDADVVSEDKAYSDVDDHGLQSVQLPTGVFVPFHSQFEWKCYFPVQLFHPVLFLHVFESFQVNDQNTRDFI